MYGQEDGVHKGIPVKRHVFNRFVGIFSIQTSHISKKRYKVQRDVWVEVLMGKRKRSQSPFRETYGQHTQL